MNKPATFLLLSLLALLNITAPTSWAAQKRTDPQKQEAGTQHDLIIFFSNDVRGEIEPCG